MFQQNTFLVSFDENKEFCLLTSVFVAGANAIKPFYPDN